MRPRSDATTKCTYVLSLEYNQVMEANTSIRPNGSLPDRIEMVDDKMAEVLRKKSPLDRLRIGASIWESARIFLGAHLGKTHPEWSEAEIQREINRRFLNAAP